MQILHVDKPRELYAVMNDKNELMAFDDSFLLPEDYQYADYRTSPSHWDRYEIAIPLNCKVVKVSKVLTVNVEDLL